MGVTIRHLLAAYLYATADALTGALLEGAVDERPDGGPGLYVDMGAADTERGEQWLDDRPTIGFRA